MTQETWTNEQWRSLTWAQKLNHNFTAFEAHFEGKPIQWWNGRRWCDETSGAKDYEIVNIEHPQRTKPAQEAT